MNSPAVSVIIPCYNAEKYLDICMESLLNQTLREIEIICVDDGSVDTTLDKLNGYAKADTRVRVFSQQNQFAGVARNLGLSQARGEYILFLDCDDFFAETLAQDAYSAAVHKTADVVLFDAQCFDETAGELRKGWFLNTALLPDKQPFCLEDCADTMFQITTPVPWTKMFRRQFLLDAKLQYQTLRHTNDFFFVFSALLMAKRIVALDKILVTYRVGQKTNLQSTKEKSPLCFYTAYKALHDKLEELGMCNAVHRSYANRVLGGCLYNLRSMKELQTQEMVFDRLRGEIFEELDIPDDDVSFFFSESDYHEMLLVKNGTFEQYLAFRESTRIRELWHSIERSVRFIRLQLYGSKQYKEAVRSAAERMIQDVKNCTADEPEHITKCAYEMVHDAFNREEFVAADKNLFPDHRRYQEFSMIQRHDYATMQDMLSRRLVVSLTSYPGRIHSMAPVLESLYQQDRKADEIILWLAKEEFPELELSLPVYLTELVEREKLTIRWCDNLKPHKKYFYALQEYPEDLVVTVDDDLLYAPDTLSSLYRSYLQYPGAVSAVRVHLMLISDGKILPYNTWVRETDCCLYTPSMQLFATGGAGTLYPPHLFRKEFFDRDAIVKNCPLADDLWLKAMELMSGVPVVAARHREPLAYLPGTQTDALKLINDEQQQNDVQLAKIIRWTDDVFGKDSFLKKLTNSDAFCPILTVESIAYHLDQERRYFRQRLSVEQKQKERTQNALRQTQDILAQKEEKLKLVENELKEAEQKYRENEARLKKTEEKRKATEISLKSSEEKRKAVENSLKVSEEKRKATENWLKVSEEKRKAVENSLKVSEEKRRATENWLKASGEKCRATEEKLKKTQNELRRVQESKPIGRQLKELGAMLKGLRESGHSRISLGFKYLVYGIAWIPEKILVFLMYYLRNGFMQTVKCVFKKLLGRG